jgi:hypothetical protein
MKTRRSAGKRKTPITMGIQARYPKIVIMQHLAQESTKKQNQVPPEVPPLCRVRSWADNLSGVQIAMDVLAAKRGPKNPSWTT